MPSHARAGIAAAGPARGTAFRTFHHRPTTNAARLLPSAGITGSQHRVFSRATRPSRHYNWTAAGVRQDAGLTHALYSLDL